MGLGAAGLRRRLAHLELQVVTPVGAPSPLSDETGYWSSFHTPHEAVEAGGPRAVALVLLDEFAETQTWRIAWACWELAQESRARHAND
jgi:hypothetical protein